MKNPKSHHYEIQLKWTGNRGEGTRTYRSYARSHEVVSAGKPVLHCSSDPVFRGDSTMYNPEELLVVSLSSCHMLWYLHLCADAGISVASYKDLANGRMVETKNGGGRFEEVVLHPEVTFEPGADQELANGLHKQAHELCFIANSVNFPVRCEPATKTPIE